jgi:hypothetical protein
VGVVHIVEVGVGFVFVSCADEYSHSHPQPPCNIISIF